MALTESYVQTPAQVADLLEALSQGQAPGHFTNQYLQDLGFTSTNHRAFIPLLKSLGFLSSDGAPTARYHSYRDKSQSRRILGEALKQTYGDLFLIRAKPTEADRPLIEGKFKSVHNVSDLVAKRMANTFFALLTLADLDAASSPQIPAPRVETPPPAEKLETEREISGSRHRPDGRAQLHYNIQIHLPATKDVEVYNAIFRSLKEHLL